MIYTVTYVIVKKINTQALAAVPTDGPERPPLVKLPVQSITHREWKHKRVMCQFS